MLLHCGNSVYFLFSYCRACRMVTLL